MGGEQSVTETARPASTQSEMVRVPVLAPDTPGLAAAIDRAIDAAVDAAVLAQVCGGPVAHGPERQCLNCDRCSDCQFGGCECDAVAEYQFEGMTGDWWG